MNSPVAKRSSFKLQFSLRTLLVLMLATAFIVAYAGNRSIQLNSSSIKSVKYNHWKNSLDVRFTNDSTYRYFKIPKAVYEELLKAESHGSYFHQSIRNGGFEYKQLD